MPREPLVARLAKRLTKAWMADPPARGHLLGAEAGGLELDPHVFRSVEVVEEARTAGVAGLGRLDHPPAPGLRESPGSPEPRSDSAEKVHHSAPGKEPPPAAVHHHQDQRPVRGQRPHDPPQRLDPESAARNVVIGPRPVRPVVGARRLVEISDALNPESHVEAFALGIDLGRLDHPRRDVDPHHPKAGAGKAQGLPPRTATDVKDPAPGLDVALEELALENLEVRPCQARVRADLTLRAVFLPHAREAGLRAPQIEGRREGMAAPLQGFENIDGRPEPAPRDESKEAALQREDRRALLDRHDPAEDLLFSGAGPVPPKGQAEAVARADENQRPPTPPLPPPPPARLLVFSGAGPPPPKGRGEGGPKRGEPPAPGPGGAPRGRGALV